MPDSASTGYLNAGYAASLSEWGTPCRLASSGSWVMERNIPGTDRVDAMGCYPLMVCEDWRRLPEDWEASNRSWITFTAVPDPLGAPAEADLRHIFRDEVRRFKTHYVVDLDRWSGPSSGHHRTRLRESAPGVETVAGPADPGFLEEWTALYSALVARHGIEGMLAFSPRSFARLFDVPGLHVARAISGGQTVAMSLWTVHGGNAYYHLGASTAAGYARSASYPMFQAAIEYLRNLGLERLDLGGGAGVAERDDDGLARFKRGWSTSKCEAWLCGRIFDPELCRALSLGRPADFFPPYRGGFR